MTEENRRFTETWFQDQRLAEKEDVLYAAGRMKAFWETYPKDFTREYCEHAAALLNEFISLLKETSISGYIGMMDLTKGGDIIRSNTYEAFIPLIAVALIYLVIVMFLSHGVSKLERRLRSNER